MIQRKTRLHIYSEDKKNEKLIFEKYYPFVEGDKKGEMETGFSMEQNVSLKKYYFKKINRIWKRPGLGNVSRKPESGIKRSKTIAFIN